MKDITQDTGSPLGCSRELRSSTEMCKADSEGSRETVPCDSIGGYNPNVMQAKFFKGSSGPQSVPAKLSRMDWETSPTGYRMYQRNAELTTMHQGSWEVLKQHVTFYLTVVMGLCVH